MYILVIRRKLQRDRFKSVPWKRVDAEATVLSPIDPMWVMEFSPMLIRMNWR